MSIDYIFCGSITDDFIKSNSNNIDDATYSRHIVVFCISGNLEHKSPCYWPAVHRPGKLLCCPNISNISCNNLLFFFTYTRHHPWHITYNHPFTWGYPGHHIYVPGNLPCITLALCPSQLTGPGEGTWHKMSYSMCWFVAYDMLWHPNPLRDLTWSMERPWQLPVGTEHAKLPSGSVRFLWGPRQSEVRLYRR